MALFHGDSYFESYHVLGFSVLRLFHKMALFHGDSYFESYHVLGFPF